MKILLNIKKLDTVHENKLKREVLEKLKQQKLKELKQKYNYQSDDDEEEEKWKMNKATGSFLYFSLLINY